MTLTPEELRDDVAAGLIEHGFKRADAILAVRESVGDDFSSLFRDALDRLQTKRDRGEFDASSQNPGRASTPLSAPTSPSRVDAKPGPANSAAGPGMRRTDSSLRNRAAGSAPGAAVPAPGKPARKETPVSERPRMCSRGCGKPTHRGACAGQGRQPKGNRGRPLGRDGLRELKPEEFNNLFRPRIGHDDWTRRVLDRIEALPLKKFYAVDIPKERSVDGFLNTLQRYFKGRAFKLRKFRGKGQNTNLMGIYKEPAGVQA